MAELANTRGWASGGIRWLLSVPIFFKVLGIGALVAVVFGSVMLYLLETSTRDLHRKVLVRRVTTVAMNLAESIEDPLITGDEISIAHAIERTRRSMPDLRYVVVRDRYGRVVSHSFQRAVPPDILAVSASAPRSKSKVEALSSNEGLIYDICTPILRGEAGMIQTGISDRSLGEQRRVLVRLVLGALGISVAGGITCTLLLTHLMTRPIHLLRETAERVRAGDFTARALVFSEDEIGELARTMNRLAQSLEEYRREVDEKEAARASLIGKIVQIQEEERKYVAQELHDQLGQSISHVLLTFQGARKGCGCCDVKCGDLENEMRGLIDEVRRLAWDMRPAALDDLGLDSALDRYVKDVSARLGIPIEYECVIPPESGRLPSKVEVTLYRIVQEALTNVIRHAHASRVSVVVLRHDAHVTLVVEDNGRGFDLESVRSRGSKSLGLVGIRERAALIGGDVEFESHPGKGTEVLVSIPLETQQYDDQDSNR
ncbi:MAG: HAMP domain-containing protein [Candidatus Hydrogenedentes bacterium]|nr:HAMP domain-containing protein [Candidatus Hydrogenedentota bacterium]